MAAKAFGAGKVAVVDMNETNLEVSRRPTGSQPNNAQQKLQSPPLPLRLTSSNPLANSSRCLPSVFDQHAARPFNLRAR